jgi:hypothetical protein
MIDDAAPRILEDSAAAIAVAPLVLLIHIAAAGPEKLQDMP